MKQLFANYQQVKVISKAAQKSINGGNQQCYFNCNQLCLFTAMGDRDVWAVCLDDCMDNC